MEANTLELKRDEQRKEAIDIVGLSDQIKIIDDQKLHQGSEYLKTMKKFIDEVNLYWKPLIDEAHKHHKSLTTKRNDIVTPIKTAYDSLRERIGNYQIEQQRKADEAQRKSEEEARKKEDAKKEKIQSKIEEAKAEGNEDKVERLEEKKENVYVAPKPVSAPAKVKGVGTRFKYKVSRIVSKKDIPLEYLILDVSKAEKVKNTMGDDFELPGVEFRKQVITSVRS